MVQLIGFASGARQFGADILSVHEILRQPAVETLEAGPEFIAGVIRIRGAVIPVVDFATHMAMSCSVSPPDKQWVLVAKVQECLVGFIVDAVTHIIRITKDVILPAPDLILAGLRNQYIRGVCETEKGLLMVLDLDRLLRDDEVITIRGLNAV